MVVSCALRRKGLARRSKHLTRNGTELGLALLAWPWMLIGCPARLDLVQCSVQIARFQISTALSCRIISLLLWYADSGWFTTGLYLQDQRVGNEIGQVNQQ